MADKQASPSRWMSHDARDAELLRRAAAGENAAFETLYRSYFKRLERFLHRMLRRSTLVEEVINDTMYVVWNRADRYSGESKVSTWIFGIAYRKALKALSGVDDPVEFDAVEQPQEQPGVGDGLLRGELRGVLNRALALMSPEQRAVVELTYFHEYPYRDIAEVMGCPVETVKTRMFYARRRLRDLLSLQRKDLPWADESSIS